KGFTLVEMMVAIGLMGILSLAVTSMLSMQRQQMRMLTQRQEQMDIKSVLLKQLSNSKTCTWQLLNQSFLASPVPTPASPSATVIPLRNQTIYSGSDPANDSTSVPIVTAGTLVQGTTTQLKVNTVTFENIYSVNASSNEYAGSFRVTFKKTPDGMT